MMGRAVEGDANSVMGYADSADIPLWAQEPMGRLTALGIINGYSDNTIKPNGLLTRAEAASLASKLLALDDGE